MLNRIVVESNIRIFEALEIIDKVGTKILFVTKKSKFIGALADSDIRRFLISGGDIKDIVEKAVNKSAKFITFPN